MNAADVRKTAEQKMQKSVEALKQDLTKVRTGRAHAGLLDHVLVDYYGNPTPIPQIGSVSLLDARTLAGPVPIPVRVYRPTAAQDLPALMYFHGGFWVRGSKDASMLNVLPYLEMGFAVVNVGYRLGRTSLAPAAGTPTISSWPTRAASDIRASTDGTAGRAGAVEAVGAADGVGVGTAGDGAAADGPTGDRLTGAGTVDGRDAAGGAGGDRLHAVAPSATTAATAARPRTL